MKTFFRLSWRRKPARVREHGGTCRVSSTRQVLFLPHLLQDFFFPALKLMSEAVILGSDGRSLVLTDLL